MPRPSSTAQRLAPVSPAAIDRSPVRPRSARTRRRLLEAGRELFAAQGLEAVTSHAIAARAGYASGTFYLHFPDKHALFGELALEAAAELEARMEATSAAAMDSGTLVRAQAEALVGFAEDRRDLLRMVLRPSGEAREIGIALLERLARGVADRRREAVASGRERDCFQVDVLAQAIVGLWAHVLAWWAEDPARASREELIRTLTHFQLHGSHAEVGSPCLVDRPVATEPAPEGDLPR
ncbi:MAG: helix-turn-helix domain-containing protein [Myxococcota bacterium]